jgi:hypothetical protein
VGFSETVIVELGTCDDGVGLGPVQAGLFMQHGIKVHVTSKTIHKYLEEYHAEQQHLVKKANQGGGLSLETVS